jgi:hypothetical protein
MKLGLVASLLCAALVAPGWAAAEDPPGVAQIGGLDACAAQAAPPASTTLRMRGTVDRYDTSTRILSLSTSNGTLKLPLAQTARVRQDSQEIDASELEKLAGCRASVRYSESGGTMTVESVHVFGKTKG